MKERVFAKDDYSNERIAWLLSQARPEELNGLSGMLDKVTNKEVKETKEEFYERMRESGGTAENYSGMEYEDYYESEEYEK